LRSPVQAKVNQVLRQLPGRRRPPVVLKVEAARSAVIWLAPAGRPHHAAAQPVRTAGHQERLETLQGVARSIGGERRRNIASNLDLDRMAALGSPRRTCAAAFRAEHVQLPGASCERRHENLIKLDLEYTAPRRWRDVVRYADGAPVRLRDVGTVEDGLADDRQVIRFNGEPRGRIGHRQGGATTNTVQLVDDVQAPARRAGHPAAAPGSTIKVSSDDSAPLRQDRFFRRSRTTREGTSSPAGGVFFLRSFRSTVIIATGHPVSLLGAIAVMYFLGYTFNQMSLLGLLLLIGVVVDDAIVVLETSIAGARRTRRSRGGRRRSKAPSRWASR